MTVRELRAFLDDQTNTAIAKALVTNAAEMLEQARRRRFLYFSCSLPDGLPRPGRKGVDFQTRCTRLTLTFADPQVIYYEERLDLMKAARQMNAEPNLDDRLDIKIVFQSLVVNTERFQWPWAGMRKHQSRA